MTNLLLALLLIALLTLIRLVWKTYRLIGGVLIDIHYILVQIRDKLDTL